MDGFGAKMNSPLTATQIGGRVLTGEMCLSNLKVRSPDGYSLVYQNHLCNSFHLSDLAALPAIAVGLNGLPGRKHQSRRYTPLAQVDVARALLSGNSSGFYWWNASSRYRAQGGYVNAVMRALVLSGTG